MENVFPREAVKFQGLAESAFGKWAPRARVLYRVLRGGRSGAAVLKVDIDGDLPANLKSGQYILKLSDPPEWADQILEKEAHETAVRFNGNFAKAHIPSIVCCDSFGAAGDAILFEIAGYSLDAYAPVDTRESTHLMASAISVTETLLGAWSESSPEQAQPGDVLKTWLGYRLERTQASELHEFIESHTNGRSVWMSAGEVFVNPIYFCSLVQSVSPIDIFVRGLVHGDLHGGNLMIHRSDPQGQPFWIIDFANCSRSYVGYDQAYLEMASITVHLSGSDPTTLIGVLNNIESDGTQLTPPGTLWLAETIRKIRSGQDAWLSKAQPRRKDSLSRQFTLARVAAGINWANKDLSREDRLLALVYASWAATEYLKHYQATEWARLCKCSEIPAAAVRGNPSESEVLLWNRFLEASGLGEAPSTRFVLIAEAQPQAAKLAALGQIPWSVAIDFDADSDLTGLFAHVSRVLENNRALHQFSVEVPVVDFARGTAWLMTSGWNLKGEAQLDVKGWVRSRLAGIRKVIQDLDRAVNPDNLTFVILRGPTQRAESVEQLMRTIDAIDEATGGRGKIFLVGVGTAITSSVAEILEVPLGVETFAALVEKAFGPRARQTAAALPGVDGTWHSVTVDTLRKLQENLEVLHSDVADDLNERGSADSGAFWRGARPSWIDFSRSYDVSREVYPKLRNFVRERLDAGRNFTVVVHHNPGSGATTLALRLAWDFHWDFPVAVLHTYSPALSTRLTQMLEASKHKVVLLIAEASDLTETQREELHQSLSVRNVRVVVVYLRRTLAPSSEGFDFLLGDPMDRTEAEGFLKIYAPLADSSDKTSQLSAITRDDSLKRYRSPFFYGLITFEHEFKKLDGYVSSHLRGVRSPVREVLEYLALVTKFSSGGVHEILVQRLLGLSGARCLDLIEVLGEGPARLVVSREGRIRIVHEVIAEEVLSELLGGGKSDWKLDLHVLSKEFIEKITTHGDKDSNEVRELLKLVFVSRPGGLDVTEDRRDFSALIETIDGIDWGLGHSVLKVLTECCPGEAHFWNHLGRHQAYRMRHDTDQSEKYLLTAIRLTPDDYVHHHTLGVVRRSSIRRQLRSYRGTSSAALLSEIKIALDGAESEFSETRRINPENLYGYITHIQLLLEVALRLKDVDRASTVAQVSQDAGIQSWFMDKVPLAEALFRDAKQLYGTLEFEDPYLTSCEADLQKLYGKLDEVIKIWEAANARGRADGAGRRALAFAYYARGHRRWRLMSEGELRRVVELMEQNLYSAAVRRDDDFLVWFEAYKELPDFDFDEALNRLKTWSLSASSWRPHYYLYTLQFLLWHLGRTNMTGEIQSEIESCQNLAVGKRGTSYLWLSVEAKACPLVSEDDLGTWDKKRGFWRNTSPLRRINGIISTITGPQAGRILLGAGVTAHFVPGRDFFQYSDENEPVNFCLGFSPVGLRAWEVKRGQTQVPPALDVGVSGSPVRIESPPDPASSAKAASSIEAKMVRQILADLLDARRNLGINAELDDLAGRIAAIVKINKDEASVLIRNSATAMGYRVERQRSVEILVKATVLAAQAPIRVRSSGQIAKYFRADGYGFIDDGTPQNLYFKVDWVLESSQPNLQGRGQLVEFTPEKGARGRLATSINILEANAVWSEGRILVGEELRRALEQFVLQLIQASQIKGTPLPLKDLSEMVFDKFRAAQRPEACLGYNTLSQFLKDVPNVRVKGTFPNLIVVTSGRPTGLL